MKWTEGPPIQPGWYWYCDQAASIGPTVLYVDQMRLACGGHCNGVEIEQLPGKWWTTNIEPPESDNE